MMALLGPVVEAAAGRGLLSVNGPAPPGADGIRAQLFCDTVSPTYDHPVDDVS
jgi:hypothetical protein